ncbi:MAG: hypothetical protein GKR87_11710 [Kiritimatiellae bacterium]|nr:hypothetical protein [Kiritimatiellia bacterium]
MNDESAFFSLKPGCHLHGEEYMIACNVCGNEFCAQCSRNAKMCPECLEPSSDYDTKEPDFEDVRDLKALIGEDEEVEKLLEDEDEIPPEDLVDKEDLEKE